MNSGTGGPTPPESGEDPPGLPTGEPVGTSPATSALRVMPGTDTGERGSDHLTRSTAGVEIHSSPVGPLT